MPSLRDKFSIKRMMLRNRMVLPPLTTNAANPDGEVSDGIIQFFRERSNDVGLVIVEAAAVRFDGRILPGSLGIWKDDQLAGLKKIVGAIRQGGASAVLQINHAGARGFPSCGEMQGASPSGFSFRPDVLALTMNVAQIEKMVGDFADAAFRAQAAGFDGVEIHGAHLYLISQFLSPLTNQREDRYGGDALGRATLALEVLRAVRQKVGEDYPILFRFNAVEHIEGGQTLADALIVAGALADAGVDALDVSLTASGTWQEVGDQKYLLATSSFSKQHPPGANIPFVAQVKEATGLPVIGVGKLGIGAVAEKAIAGSLMDLVAVGRQMIADPASVGHLLGGRPQDIIPCEECMACYASMKMGPVVCKVNKNLPWATNKN